MKSIYTAAVLLLVLHSCSFLEVEERGKTDTDTFFAEIEGLRTAITGLYSCAYDFYDCEIIKYAEAAGDNLKAVATSSGSEMYYQYNFLNAPEYETTSVGFIWKRGYVVVTNANTILNYSGDLKKAYPANVDEISHIEGQAVFLRALAHFEMVQCYAQTYAYTADASHLGIPVVTRVVGTDEVLGRNTVRQVYDQIISDLNVSRSLLSASASDTDYVTLRAVDALLSRVYLYMGDYVQAETAASAALDGLKLTSHDKYQDMFTGEEKGSEAIFSLTGKYGGTRLMRFFNYEAPDYVPVEEFVEAFPAGDIRAQLLESPLSETACMKYYDLKSDSPVERFSRIHVLRGSEILLNRAEARCMQGKLEAAAGDVKAIIARAEGKELSEITVPSGQKELLRTIKTERNRELCFEGHRFFDIARWKEDLVRTPSSNSSMKRLEWPDYRFILPISQVEMDVNEAMVQNEGY